MKRRLAIHKFGGTSLGSAERIEAAAAILRDASRRERVVAVVSATAGTTNALLEAAHDAQRGRRTSWMKLLASIAKRHSELAQRYDGRAALREIDVPLRELETMLEGIALLRELSPRTLDAVASFGERLSAPIVARALRAQGVPAQAVDARSLIRTDDRHQRATADLAATRRAARRGLGRLLARGSVPVVTGFIASGPQGETTTLGRSGSDTTAAILGAVLGASRIVIWTDVDGVISPDPLLVDRAGVHSRRGTRDGAELN